ncbi:Retrotransposon protein [Nesidiocoris tenuis]|uniref:Retrotransposon protein n=2 Tax=Nesidiocoris tenuis TaxID=355587 RepID=A0ABN7B8E5_9HEMI|nr:Retrotransposon protein [Nesidiocoris tenuis]
MPEGGEDAARSSARAIRAAKREMKTAGTQIAHIRNKGFAAVSSSAERGIFRGMFATVENFFQTFNRKWEELADLHDEEGAAAPYPSPEEENYFREITNYYFEIHNFHLQINSRVGVPNTNPNLDTTVTNPTSRAILPKIHIKNFGGDITQWPTFKQLFTSLIKEEPSLTDSERFHYLLGYLYGPAYDCVKHIAAVGENFPLAWAALLKTYDCPRKLACSYLNRFLSYKPSSSKPTADTLREYIANVSESIASLRNLDIADLAEYLLCELALRSLDPYTREAFETSIVGTVYPQFTTLQDFVQNRCQVLSITQDAGSFNRPPPTKTDQHPNRAPIGKPPNYYTSRPTTSRQALMARGQSTSSNNYSQYNNQPQAKTRSCFICKGNHTVVNCFRFRAATPQHRLDLLRSFHGCLNCLSVFHKQSECTSAYSCQKCQRRHHTDLHVAQNDGETPAPRRASSQPRTGSQTGAPSSSFAGAATNRQSGVLLGTITAVLKAVDGTPLTFRGVLDPGSQYSFATEDCARKLRCPTRPFRGHISGVDQTPLHSVKGMASLTFLPPQTDASLATEAVIVPTITPPLPQVELQSACWDYYRSYDLSDQDFAKPGPISFLIGADLFPEVITGAPITLLSNGPRLMPTVFGLTVMGRYEEEPDTRSSLALLAHGSLTPIIERFWQIEEPSFDTKMSPEDEYCEQHFTSSHYRTDDGRYVVSLPFRTVPPTIVPNTARAINCFYSLEKKLMKDEELGREYRAQIDEYLQLGQMSPAKDPPKYVIPHHAVFKTTGEKRKLRIVFDASFPAPSGSLNDHLYTGTKLQADITNILLKFRQHRYVFSCDIVKMFRQIWLTPEHRNYLQIVWRPSPEDPLQFYCLNTVTFGLSSSPFLAQRVLQQHARNYQARYPEAAAVILESTYIDDITAGADSLAHLAQLKTDLIDLLRLGGFELSKWSSNHPALLDPSDQWDRSVHLGSEDLPATKILGLKWNPADDVFSYDVTAPPEGHTRRVLLSTIARLYDPLGYLAPVIFTAKRVLQLTWMANLKWDEEVPSEILKPWKQFVNELPMLQDISIARPFPTASQRQLIYFCDASTEGYCAVAYLRSSDRDDITLTLLKAKTKLAPLKTLTVPRLELCGALLLSKLHESLKGLQSSLGVTEVYCFSDSTTVIAWLRTPPHLLHIFVSNRVQQILSNTQIDWWRHIKGVENPADVGSRGIAPAALQHHALWWNGPEWCRLPIEQWPEPSSHLDEIPEMRKTTPVLLSLGTTSAFVDIAKRHSRYPTFVRVMAYVCRFLHNSRCTDGSKQQRITGPISALEYSKANHQYVRALQRHYHPEVFTLPFNELSTELRRLNVFVDAEGLIRVGGRLANAPLPYEEKHPILLPKRSPYTNLLVNHHHLQNHHVGPAGLLASVRQQYWIPGAKNLIRTLRHKCVVCTRFSRTRLIPFMGQLPKSRFSGTRPFLVTGVDFAGPFLMKTSSARKAMVQKTYLCLFICMTTRAVHLEVAMGLSVEAFLNVLDNFVSKRGWPSEILSDGGTNFRGTDRYLREITQMFEDQATKDRIVRYTAPQTVRWNFNPPSSPHFGGGWEVSIRMVKELLYKTFGNQPYTLPDLITAFNKIEAILNSRPLQALSSSPDDLEALTPGHFLIGQPLTAVPEPDFTDVPVGRLNQWQRLRERVQYFWTRWRKEYLSSLQTRQKWDRHQPNLKVNDLVLLIDVDASPTSWPLGRIIETHPGADNVVRVVTVRTRSGVYRRPSVKMLPLTLEDIHA